MEQIPLEEILNGIDTRDEEFDTHNQVEINYS
jgi:hypothetical protein